MEKRNAVTVLAETIHKRLSNWLACGLIIFTNSLSAETLTDSALWTGGLFLIDKEKRQNYSAEYQVRLDDHMSSLSSHFLDLLAYRQTTDNLILNGGYRFTVRPDHVDHRVYVGGFWDITKNSQPLVQEPDRFRVVLQFGYQHDFNAEYDDQQMGSDSVRWVVVASQPAVKKVWPFLMVGVLTTWNDAYSFGVDKIRMGGGFVLPLTAQSRLRSQYIWEKSRFTEPEKQTHILWIRYEGMVGL